MDLKKSKTAVITGGSSGIGRAMALHLARSGTLIAACDIHPQNNERLQTELNLISRGHLVVDVDVSDRDAVHRFADRVAQLFGGVDFLFCNAGVGGEWGGFTNAQQGDWYWCLKTNVLGIVHTLEAFIPRIVEHELESSVVITSSIAGLLPGPSMGAYSPSKYAAVSIAESLGLELAETRTHVAVLCTGFVDTDFLNSGRHLKSAPQFDTTDPDNIVRRERVRSQMNASISPESVVDAVVMGVSENKRYILTHPQFRTSLEHRFTEILAAC